jgi:hypothetical protein
VRTSGRALGERLIDLEIRRFIQPIVLHIGHDADDRDPRHARRVALPSEALPDRAFVRPEPPGERLIYYTHPHGAIVVRVLEAASLEQGRAECAEVPGRHGSSIGDEHRIARSRLLALHDHVALRVAARERDL